MGYNLDTTAVTPVLKNRYTPDKIQTLAFLSPTVARFPKDTESGGNAYIGAIRNATASSVSGSDAVAFTQGNASVYQQWVIPWSERYGAANITGGAIARSKGNDNAMADGMLGEFDGIFISLGMMLGNDVWNNGGSAIGQISSTSNVGTATITLADINKVVNIQVNQILQTSATDGTSGTIKTGTVIVTGVDVMLGTVTVSGASWTAGIATAAAGDYIFLNGTFGGGMKGIPGWIPTPTARPTSGDSFCGVNRFSDPTRLAGNYYVGGGGSKRETMNRLAILTQRLGGRPTDLAVNPVDYGDLLNELGTNVRYTTVQAFENPQIAFGSVELMTAYGALTIYQDPFVPAGFAWMLNFDDWLMPSMGEVPEVIGEGTDGQDWLRQTGVDAYQLRAVYRAALYCKAPGRQGCLSW